MSEHYWNGRPPDVSPDRVKAHIFFTEHMFERYRERVLGNEDIPVERVMKDLVPGLNHVCILDKSHPRHRNSVFCVCEQCVFLGTSYREDDIVVFATTVGRPAITRPC